MRKFLFTFLLSSVAACAAEEPGIDNGGPMGADAAPDKPTEEGVRLSVNGIQPQTNWLTVPVSGKGPPKGTLLIEATGGTLSTDLESDGSFCIDVRLSKDTLNTLTLTARHAETGEPSEPVALEILQDGEPIEPGETVAAKNIALGGLPNGNTDVEEQEGSFAAMTDGDLTTSVLLEDDLFSHDQMVIRTPVADSVNKIRVYSDVSCPLEEYIMHTAAEADDSIEAPGTREPEGGTWDYRGHFGKADGETGATDCSTGEYVCQEFSFAAEMVEAIGINFISDDCESWNGTGYHRVLEVQAWTPAGVAPPDVGAPSCKSGI